MGKRNVASGNDRVAMQAGQVLGSKGRTTKPADDDVQEPGESTNIRSGNATVGRQADVVIITGGVRIGW